MSGDQEDHDRMMADDNGKPKRSHLGFEDQLRLREWLDAKADTFIGYAVDGARRMETLIRDLLAFSRVGREQVPPGPVEAGAAVREALRNLEHALQEAGGRVDIGPLPVISAVRTLLVQLFQNLLGNAIKFHGEAAPRIVVTAEPTDGGWTFCVRDHGIGIEAAHVDRIFRPFQRLHARGEYPGNGIGLAICRRIVEHHGGRIWAESVTGQGAAFRFEWPRDPSGTTAEALGLS